MNSSLSTSTIRKTMFNYLAMGSLILSIAIFVGTTTPVYSRLQKAEDTSIQHITQTTAMAIDEWMRRMQDLAWQITSRTRIRQELEKFNNGKITLTQLKAFTEPKLNDALNFSEVVAGIARLDKNNHIVATCGKNIPRKKWEPVKQNGKDIAISVPFRVEDYYYFIISAPILNRENNSVGTDLVLIDMCDLNTIISMRTNSAKTIEVIVGYFSGNDFSTIFPKRAVQSAQLGGSQHHYRQMLDAEKQSEVSLSKFGGSVAGFIQLESFDWWLVISQKKRELYAELHNKLLFIGLLVVGLYLVFLFGFKLVTKPLAGKLLLHTSELETAILEKTSKLNQEIEIRKQTEKAHEKTIEQLKAALFQVKTLSGLLPICSHCKKIRDDQGYWNTLESYIQKHSDAEFSHSICQECARKHYPNMDIYSD